MKSKEAGGMCRICGHKRHIEGKDVCYRCYLLFGTKEKEEQRQARLGKEEQVAPPEGDGLTRLHGRVLDDYGVVEEGEE